MKVSVELDDELLRTAREFRPKTSLSKLLSEALKALIHMEASRRLAALGGTEPHLRKIKRTRAGKP